MATTTDKLHLRLLGEGARAIVDHTLHPDDIEDRESDIEDEISDGRATDKTIFGITTDKVGQESGYHTLNPPKSPEQRRTVTAYHGSVDVYGESLAIIHGSLGAGSDQFASLLVFEFWFDGVRWKSRIPWVSMLLEFRSSVFEMPGPLVHDFTPQGAYALLPHDQEESNLQEASVNGGVAQMGNFTRIKGMRICDAYGDAFGVKWILEENPAGKTGVPTYLRTALLLERQEDVKFEAEVKIEYEIDRRSWKERFLGAKDQGRPRTQEFPGDSPDTSYNNVLHLLTDICNKVKLLQTLPLIEHLVEDSPVLLQRVNNNADSPLHVAIANKNHRMFNYLLNSNKDLDDALSCSNGQGENCIHFAIERGSRSLDRLVSVASADTLSAKDSNGNTPLHTAVHYDYCDKKSLAIIQAIIAKSDAVIRNTEEGDFNRFQNGIKTEQMSPFTYHLWTRDRTRDPGRIISESKAGAGADKRQDIKLGSLHPKSVMKANVSQRRADSPARSQQPQGSEKTEGKLVLASSDSQGAREDLRKVSDNIQRFLKKHYLRTRRYEVALNVLQGRDAVTRKEIYLDLSNKSGATLVQVDRMIGTLEFEDVLQYVHISQFKTPSNDRQSSRRQPRGETVERIFQNDRLKGVTTVLKIIVEDLGGQPHSDTAIEGSLRGKGAEIWDWRNVDMCTDVIQQAAPGSSESEERNKSNSGAFEKRLRRLFHEDRAQEYVDDIENRVPLRISLEDAVGTSITRAYGQGPLQLAQKRAIFIASEAIGGILCREMLKVLPQSMSRQAARDAKSEPMPDYSDLNAVTTPLLDAFMGLIVTEILDELCRLEQAVLGLETQTQSITQLEKELDKRTRPATERVAKIVETQISLNPQTGTNLAAELVNA
ncbi:hypothetical protein BDV19DRAFT_391141 [Aspergillus venezuelensis]